MARMYPGQPPKSDRAWVPVEGFHEEWELWLWWNTYSDTRCCKLFAKERAANKANYWFAHNGKRLTGGKDWKLLRDNRPELYQQVLEVLSDD